MSVIVSPTGATTALLTNGPANPPAKSTSSPTTVTDTVQLSTEGQAAVLTPEEAMLDETDTYVQLVKSADNGDPRAMILLNALDSIPPPQVP